MPEGHTVHRTANKFAKLFANKQLEVSSPQGRFTDSRLVSGQQLVSADAIGKQMFLFFEHAVVRVHLGIYGKWRFANFDDAAPAPIGQVRARFLSEAAVADLVGPTACEVIDSDQVALVQARLGPDPLRQDLDGLELARFLTKASKTKAAIGQFLMNQAAIAGIGNVYRAELLFRQGINPHLPTNLVPTELLEKIWQDATFLMQIGVKKGIMLTREGYLNGRPALADRYYVYKREGLPCRICGAKVSLELMSTRKLYWCRTCQK